MKKYLILFILTLSLSINAQQTTVAAGGVAYGIDGTASYSIGQSVYDSKNSASGAINEGVQQPYQVIELLSDSEIEQYFNINVYPNPTSNLITLEVGNYEINKLTYKLFDVNGKLLITNSIIGKKTNIPMDKLASANYFLKVTTGNKNIATFKILKNN
jgi:hypothetical protein